MFDLNTLVNPAALTAAGFQGLTHANDINDAGQIVGWGIWTDGDGQLTERGFLLTPLAVPEPTLFALLALGLIGVAALHRR